MEEAAGSSGSRDKSSDKFWTPQGNSMRFMSEETQEQMYDSECQEGVQRNDVQ
jgi:hypothetical protein